MEFSEILKELRIERGISQTELAKHCSVSSQCISSLEVGRRSPTGSTLEAIAKYFNVSIDYLLGLTDEFGGAPGGASSQAISPDEEEILMLFRAMSKTQRTRLVAFGEGLLSGSDTWQKPLNRPKKP